MTRWRSAAALLLVAGCGARESGLAAPASPTTVGASPSSGTPSGTPTTGLPGTTTTSPSPSAGAGSASVVAPSATTAPPRTTSPPAGGTLALDEADGGGTFRVTVGTTIVVRLDGGQVAPWSVAQSSDGNVVRRLSGTTGDGSSRTTFRAVGNGRADLSATAHPRCRDVQPPCGAPDRLWTVTILVTR